MRDIVKMFDNKQFALSNVGEIYYLTNRSGVAFLKMYMPQFIIQLDENRFAVGSGTNCYNRKSFAIYNYDPVRGNLEKEFGCEYYGRDDDNYHTILRNIRNMYRNKKFLLQGNNRVLIYDAENQSILTLRNIPGAIRTGVEDDKITAKTIAKSQNNARLTDEVEFVINKKGIPITGFYSNLQGRFLDLLSPEETAKFMHTQVEKVSYEDELNATYVQKVLYYLNSMSYSNRSGGRRM